MVPRDIATREIFQVCIEGHGVAGENQVYLDLTHIPAAVLTERLGAILEIYEMFVGDDPRFYVMHCQGEHPPTATCTVTCRTGWLGPAWVPC